MNGGRVESITEASSAPFHIQNKKEEYKSDTDKVATTTSRITSADDKVVLNEMSNSGSVKLQTFINYMKAMPGGILSGILLGLVFLLTQGSVVATIAITGRWSLLPDQLSSIMYVVVGLVLTVIILALGRALVYYYLVIGASQHLHNRMLQSVLRANTSFFDANNVGRILNRFSADVGSNDDLLPNTMFECLTILFMVIGAMISVLTVLPIVFVSLPFILGILIKIRYLYVKNSRELKRIEGLSRSPIFSLMSESMNGIATIRANGAVSYFQKKFRDAHDVSTVCFDYSIHIYEQSSLILHLPVNSQLSKGAWSVSVRFLCNYKVVWISYGCTYVCFHCHSECCGSCGK